MDYNLKIVKGIKSKHLDIWKSWLSSDYVMKDFDFRPKDLNDLDNWFDQIIIYFLELDNVPIGMIDIYKSDFHENEMEIGYIVLPEHSGKGYAKLLVQHIISIAKQEGIRSILAYTTIDNIPSQKVLINNGFQFVEERQVNNWDFYNNPQPWKWYKLEFN